MQNFKAILSTAIAMTILLIPGLFFKPPVKPQRKTSKLHQELKAELSNLVQEMKKEGVNIELVD